MTASGGRPTRPGTSVTCRRRRTRPWTPTRRNVPTSSSSTTGAPSTLTPRRSAGEHSLGTIQLTGGQLVIGFF